MKRRKVVFGSPLDVVIQEEEIRQPSSNEVLVKTVVTLVSSGTEMTAFRGNFPPGSAWAGYVRYPFTPGYSNVAKVVKVGKRAGSLAPGDLVFSWAPHCSHAVLSKDAVTKIPAGMNVRDAVFGTLGQIALNGIRLAEIALGDCVIVAGLGPLGQLALQCARGSAGHIRWWQSISSPEGSKWRWDTGQTTSSTRAVRMSPRPSRRSQGRGWPMWS